VSQPALILSFIDSLLSTLAWETLKDYIAMACFLTTIQKFRCASNYFLSSGRFASHNASHKSVCVLSWSSDYVTLFRSCPSMYYFYECGANGIL